jgi:hypothetical protein
MRAFGGRLLEDEYSDHVAGTKTVTTKDVEWFKEAESPGGRQGFRFFGPR